ncbi:MarR family winged helix-turn-helix transcriptional regulator [Roseibium sediminis]|uniref:MarR family winged helix-turn-helix transcriptional regulator n=1 Tax=Roseibium sediminis TaxID=1775174 RepID=UPI001864DB2E|nr:MarR family transcriptional regulator [Roseibium sediminis]
MSLLAGLVPDDEQAAKKTAKKAKAGKAANGDLAVENSQAAADKPARKTPAGNGKAAKASSEPDETAAVDPVSGVDALLCFALYSANHAMNKVYKPLLNEVGLTYPQYLAMTVLWEKDKVPVGDLTEKLQLETSTITPLLKRMETMGLVNRARSKKDERQVRISLTKKGKDLQAKTSHFQKSFADATGLSSKAYADLHKKVLALRETMRAFEG